MNKNVYIKLLIKKSIDNADFGKSQKKFPLIN